MGTGVPKPRQKGCCFQIKTRSSDDSRTAQTSGLGGLLGQGCGHPGPETHPYSGSTHMGLTGLVYPFWGRGVWEPGGPRALH